MHGRIVVGYDGSADAEAALRMALDLARRWDAELVAISCWLPPLGPVAPKFEVTGEHLRDLERQAAEALAAGLRACGAAEGLVVDRRVVESRPADALLEAAKEADMLVVGSHGRGGLRRLRLGSVARECVFYASCPVVVVPPRHLRPT